MKSILRPIHRLVLFPLRVCFFYLLPSVRFLRVAGAGGVAGPPSGGDAVVGGKQPDEIRKIKQKTQKN